MAPSSLHPTLHLSLTMVPPQVGALLVLRHSIRESGDDLMATFKVPLTAEGVALARRFGQDLERPVQAAWSSKVPRCVDTARSILEGAKQSIEVGVGDVLCEPGCYVEDMGEAGAAFGRLGAIEFVNRQLGGRSVPGTIPADEGTAILLGWLKERQPDAGNLNLFVTHDTILSTFVYRLMDKRRIVEEDWPWMMEGVCVWFEGDVVRWVWRGTRGETPMADHRNLWGQW